MIDSLLHPGFDPEAALARATALGSWVASKAGAQPEYDNTVPVVIGDYLLRSRSLVGRQ